jgi:hypothetical protein
VRRQTAGSYFMAVCAVLARAIWRMTASQATRLPSCITRHLSYKTSSCAERWFTHQNIPAPAIAVRTAPLIAPTKSGLDMSIRIEETISLPPFVRRPTGALMIGGTPAIRRGDYAMSRQVQKATESQGGSKRRTLRAAAPDDFSLPS